MKTFLLAVVFCACLAVTSGQNLLGSLIGLGIASQLLGGGNFFGGGNNFNGGNRGGENVLLVERDNGGFDGEFDRGFGGGFPRAGFGQPFYAQDYGYGGYNDYW
ncbi:uncharacterized protein LOC134692675 [Mytilus trossulus]|uniref:uncharacterized protein LOC134692675 n=1 Tax=Mytilus trossulus TaxID=6551 RepID=UPI003006A54B